MIGILCTVDSFIFVRKYNDECKGVYVFNFNPYILHFDRLFSSELVTRTPETNSTIIPTHFTRARSISCFLKCLTIYTGRSIIFFRFNNTVYERNSNVENRKLLIMNFHCDKYALANTCIMKI